MANDVGRVTGSGRVAAVNSPEMAPAAAPSPETPGDAFAGSVRGTKQQPTGLTAPVVRARPRYPYDYSVDEVLHDPARAQAFVRDYFKHEAPFFGMARDARTGLSFDGWDLDPVTRAPLRPRRKRRPT